MAWRVGSRYRGSFWHADLVLFFVVLLLAAGLFLVIFLFVIIIVIVIIVVFVIFPVERPFRLRWGGFDRRHLSGCRNLGVAALGWGGGFASSVVNGRGRVSHGSGRVCALPVGVNLKLSSCDGRC